MKIIPYTVLILIGLWLHPVYAGLTPYNPATMQYETTPDQAVTTIRTWVGDPSLSLTFAGVYLIASDPSDEEYVYHSDNYQTFEVRCHTGWLWSWTNGSEFKLYKTSLQNNLLTPLSQTQLEQAAVTFARQHYPNFDALNMQEQTYDDGKVTFYSQPVPGVWFKGNLCSIDIDNYTGQAFRYVAGTANSSVTVSTTASLSAPQAEAIALNWLVAPVQPDDPAFGSDPVLSAFTTQPSELWIVNDDLGQQRLIWLVYAAKSQTEPNYTYSQWVQNDHDLAASCEVGIDANTGEIATYEEWLGGKPSTSRSKNWQSLDIHANKEKVSKHIAKRIAKTRQDHQHLNFRMAGADSTLMYPPFQIGGHAYLYAKYLSYGISGAKFLMAGDKQMTITGPGRQVSFNLNSLAYQVNGQTKQMSAKPIIINGRCYVPLDVMNAVLPGKFTYEAKAETVRYDPPQSKQAAK